MEKQASRAAGAIDTERLLLSGVRALLVGWGASPDAADAASSLDVLDLKEHLPPDARPSKSTKNSEHWGVTTMSELGKSVVWAFVAGLGGAHVDLLDVIHRWLGHDKQFRKPVRGRAHPPPPPGRLLRPRVEEAVRWRRGGLGGRRPRGGDRGLRDWPRVR